MDLAEQYLELVLRFQQIAPSLVEGYTGPPELSDRVAAEPRLSEPELAERAADLHAAVLGAELEPDQTAWLVAQTAGIETACNWMSGDALGYRELCEHCHGIEPLEAEEAQFAEAHELIMEALPGPGTAAERYQRWRRTQLVSGEQLVSGLRALADELARRTRERWGLPDGEEVAFETVQGPHWAANADYRGDLRTVVQINDELPIPAWRMVELVAHEAYPGHHTEQVCKDATLVRERGRRELCVWVHTTPQALVAEAIAMLAPEILLDEEIEEVSAECLRPLGIDYDISGSSAARRAHELLVPLRANLALWLDEGRIDSEGVRAYARRWLLEEDGYVERVVDGLEHRDWPPYESCYPEGLRLCRRFVGGDSKRFGRLLHEQLTPAVLLA